MTTKASSTAKTHQPNSTKANHRGAATTTTVAAAAAVPLHGNTTTGLMTPTSPPYPPYAGGAGGFVDPAQLRPGNGYDDAPAAQAQAQAQAQVQAAQAAAAAHYHHHQAAAAAAYMYPLSPQFQYYSDGGSSYPGSPAIHPQSPAISPTSPPFSPPLLSPPMHPAYMIHHHHHPHHHHQHHQQHFPPLHISSPILTGIPGSPPAPPLPSSVAGGGNAAAAPPLPPHGYLPALFDSHQHHKRHHSHDQEDHHYHTHNIYVRGLAENVTDESFEDLCRSYGNIISSKAILDQKSGQCKGYGFAMYEKENDCHQAIEDLNRRGLQASFARVGQESFSSRLRSLQDETSTNIYISNLPLDMTEQKLEMLFHPCQTVSNRILRDPQSNLSRGVGFARLADRSSALAIIEKFNGQTVAGSSAPLQVRFADSPAQKKLKNQTARKKMFRPPRDFQPMAAGFPPPLGVAVSAATGRPMPITPEDMLGIATPVMTTTENNGNSTNTANGSSSPPPPVAAATATQQHSNNDRQAVETNKAMTEKDSAVAELISETEQLTVS
ncbi:hypothetical protein BDB00DRAFT_783933 [Zychaea mexicana]|uniref:uncharacterized protein n=1 Tax=Zychaea mexicana TaxID=64656 RepID=UPI0022FDD310|nr:uncharacterized protein BDB00DRAFT_783933 [Zychaea mexicana]KAI9498295.1 hypothetical protein BDB00DRAFT_783933 [Zychaea mexicana]